MRGARAGGGARARARIHRLRAPRARRRERRAGAARRRAGAAARGRGRGTRQLDEAGRGADPFTPEAKSAIEHALGVAIARHDRHIGPTQVLLALLEQTPVQDLVRSAGVAPEEVLGRLGPADVPAVRDDELPQDRADAELLLRIARRDGAVAAWLRERGIDESAISERFGER